MFEYEKQKLYDYLGDSLVELLRDHQCYIAGGTITSLFTNRDINDIDVYFRSPELLVDFIYDVYGTCTIMSHTKKATMFVQSGREVQLVHFAYFPDAQSIFDSFDFTVCMGAFDFATEEFIMHPSFMQHNSQRIIKYNPNTAYPLVSMLRVQKYEKKGYTISKPEFIRILLSCMNLDITSYAELREHLGGMYGVNYDELFKELDGPFDLEHAIESIANLTMLPSKMLPDGIKFHDVDDLVSSIENVRPRAVKICGEYYRVRRNDVLSNPIPSKHIDKFDIVDSHEWWGNGKVYKFVRKVDGRYTSYYNSRFEYKISEMVEAERPQLRGIFFGQWNDMRGFTYSSNDDKALLELHVEFDDLLRIGEAKCAKVLREVPMEAYKHILDKDNEIF